MDPFRRMFLDHIESITAKRPNGSTLTELLTIASPNLIESDIDDAVARSKSFKILKARIHPDKHPNDARATKLFQKLENFYEECVVAHNRVKCTYSGFGSHAFGQRTPFSPNPRFNKKPRTSSPPNSTVYPLEFNVEKKWPHARVKQSYNLSPTCSALAISSIVAYQCMNARGAIAHGRKTELSMGPQHNVNFSACEVFEINGGSKVLRTVHDIKKELMNNGPVVSTCFVQSEALMKTVRHSNLLVPTSTNRQTHPVLIIGWRHTSIGEAWLIKPCKDNNETDVNISIAFGQHGIDANCIAPANNFENQAWQEGPYWDITIPSASNWQTWPSIEFTPIESDFDKVEILKEGIISAVQNKTRFVLRDSKRIAHSRMAYLTEMKRIGGKWKVTAHFITS